MIIFDLACQHGHPFEGWFNSAPDYESQTTRGLVSCPQCGSCEVRRLPSALHLAKPANAPVATDKAAKIDTRGGMLAAYRQLLSVIVANSDDVGKEFASEARKIHYMEAPARSIRGQASVEDYETLREEGIDVVCLPIVNKDNLS